jgi:subtilisin family serine protease
VTSAGNDGPASLTVGSPATANTAIAVGAVATPENSRVYWDYFYGLGFGNYVYNDENPQVFYFSSRGPTADGRDKPAVSAVGVMVLSAFTGSPGALGWASGTSMSCPAVSGTVALLNSYSESEGRGASPYDYKQAVIAGSTPLPGWDELDQGAWLFIKYCQTQRYLDSRC